MLQILSNFMEMKSITSIILVSNLKKSKHEKMVFKNFKKNFILVQRRKILRKLGDFQEEISCKLLMQSALNLVYKVRYM